MGKNEEPQAINEDPEISLQPAVYKQSSTLPEMMYSLASLTELYEIGLIDAVDMESHEMYQHILTHLRRVACAPAAYFLRYQAVEKKFMLTASQGEGLAITELVTTIDGAEMEHLAMRGPGETVAMTTIDGQPVLIITLSYNCVLLGIVVLTQDEHTLLSERMLLLSYLGNIAALLLHNYEAQHARCKAVLDRERNRIARDIHDDVAQRIVHALHKMELIQRLLERQQNQLAQDEVERAYVQIEIGLQHLRQSITSLLPAELEAYPFVQALQTLLEEYRNNNPGTEIVSSISKQQLPADLEIPIFRFIQEALNNIFQHAQATHVELQIYVAYGLLIVEVCDNGVGMVLEQATHKRKQEHSRGTAIGLHTMRERVLEAGGRWDIQSGLQSGTIVRAQFPLATLPNLLTNRERDILRLIVEGMTNRTIARELSISNDTVKSHIRHIIQKMHVKDRTEAAVLAARQGWL
jgi:signal transduction histidine kinase/DNA-binding CsgD family transcriptional regulator